MTSDSHKMFPPENEHLRTAEMGGAKLLMRASKYYSVAAALLLLAAPVHAANDRVANELAVCRALTNHVADLLRAGETATASRSLSRLKRCLKLQRAELDRAARDIVKRHNDSVRRSSGQSI
jgi:hypothetical protein